MSLSFQDDKLAEKASCSSLGIVGTDRQDSSAYTEMSQLFVCFNQKSSTEASLEGCWMYQV